jgi:hypothetical protein
MGEWRRLNYGLRTLTNPVTVRRLSAEIANYSASDAEALTLRLRKEVSIDHVLDRLIELYGEAIASARPDPAAHHAAMLRFINQTVPRERTHRFFPWTFERNTLIARIDQLERELADERRKQVLPDRDSEE